MFRLILSSLLLSCVFVLGGCGGSNNLTGLAIFFTDAPIDNATAVNVGVSDLKVIGPNGTYDFPSNPVSTVNFYQLQGGTESTEIAGAHIPNGNYTGISITFSADPGGTTSAIALSSGTIHELYIPSGDPTTITVPVNFSIISGHLTKITLDLDLRKSIMQDPNDSTKYIFKPALRAIDNDESGNISGFVDNSLITSGCFPSIYAFSGDVTPTDVNINAASGTPQPISSAFASLNPNTGQFNFTVAYLPAGQYTLGFTCQADKDNPAASDAITFTATGHATVSKRNTTIITLK